MVSRKHKRVKPFITIQNLMEKKFTESSVQSPMDCEETVGLTEQS